MRHLLILLLACTAIAADGANPWRTDFDEAIAEARATGATRPLAVLLSHPSCSWCHRMIAESAESPAVVRACNDVVAVVLDAQERPDLAAMLGIHSYPTLILVNRGGQEVRRVGGYLPPDDLATTLRVLAISGDTQTGTASALTTRIDPDELVRTATGREQLIAMLGRGPAGMRAKVRAALALSREARPLLWPLLADVTLSVRCDATAALAGILDDTHGYDPFAEPEARAEAAARWRRLDESPP